MSLLGDAWASLMSRLFSAFGGDTGEEDLSNEDTATAPAETDDSDLTALARMLASEDKRSYGARVVVGWLTIQHAKHTGRTIYETVTGGNGYGPQKRIINGRTRVLYASTASEPRAADMSLASRLLSGAVQPSQEIRSHKSGAWVERGQGVPDESIVSDQVAWNEGIYGRLAGTNWFLYSSDSPKIQPSPSASEALDQVPIVPALDAQGVA